MPRRYDTIRYGMGVEAIISDNMINHHVHVDVGVLVLGLMCVEALEHDNAVPIRYDTMKPFHICDTIRYGKCCPGSLTIRYDIKA